MVQKTQWGILATSFLLLSLFLGIYSDASSSDTETEGNFESQNRSKIEIVKDMNNDGQEFWYTKSYRPRDDMYGGAIINKDNRKLVIDSQSESHKIHGRLIIEFENKKGEGTGTLVSPLHVLTAGHNIYDIDSKKWAKNITFIPSGFDQEKGVKFTTATICNGWEQEKKDYDIGIISLAQPIGWDIGWNGMMYLDNNLLSSFSVTVSGYPGDKTPGTMWEDKSPISKINEKQFMYTLSTFSGQSGSNPWIKLSNPIGYYSLGVHAYGSLQENTATRLTKGKLSAFVTCINKDL